MNKINDRIKLIIVYTHFWNIFILLWKVYIESTTKVHIVIIIIASFELQ